MNRMEGLGNYYSLGKNLRYYRLGIVIELEIGTIDNDSDVAAFSLQNCQKY